MLVGATPASADSSDNDGLNIGNDNNLSVLPVQLCGNNVGVLGLVAPIASPQNSECVNAPIVDHPEKPEKPEPPTEHPQPPTEHPEPPTHHPKPPHHHHHHPHHPKPPVEHVSEELPMAPAPEMTEGHVAVTG
ncbi:hypothetical protein [Saccharopolyspora dendranthemae]|uniref:Small secreted domain DUF320 n=1 Tax=Saccharopolyspora dendranthemae TaxID=1181886 RepID=A0A561V8J2_9PSEU|nr:hypothetical protein [Saccharopolyspora dendranthemae]TWG07939.1 hypothetical protein FHU35_11558 [Saccharopolyspora dendranthemae]